MSLFFLKCLLKRHDVDVVQLYLQWLKQLHTLGLIALTVSTVSPWLKSLVWQKHPSLVHCQHFYFIFFNYWSFWKCWTLIISHRTFSRGGTSFYREEYVTTSQKRQTSSDVQMPSGASAMRPPRKGELFTHFSFVCLLFSIELISTRIA